MRGRGQRGERARSRKAAGRHTAFVRSAQYAPSAYADRRGARRFTFVVVVVVSGVVSFFFFILTNFSVDPCVFTDNKGGRVKRDTVLFRPQPPPPPPPPSPLLSLFFSRPASESVRPSRRCEQWWKKEARNFFTRSRRLAFRS